MQSKKMRISKANNIFLVKCGCVKCDVVVAFRHQTPSAPRPTDTLPPVGPPRPPPRAAGDSSSEDDDDPVCCKYDALALRGREGELMAMPVLRMLMRRNGEPLPRSKYIIFFIL